MRLKSLPKEEGSNPFLAGRAFITVEEEREIWCALGYAGSLDEAAGQIGRIKAQGIESCLEETKRFWDERLDVIKVNTPNQAFDFMFNRWLLYQSFSSRFYGRARYYQVG